MVCRGSSFFVKYTALSPKYSLSLRFRSFKRLIQKLNKPIIPWRIYYKQVSGLAENSSSPSQAGIKIARRNISNLRYTDDITLMIKSNEDLKSLLMKVKEKSEKVGLKVNI